MLNPAPKWNPVSPIYQPLVVVLLWACAGVVVDRYAGLSLTAWTVITLSGWIIWLCLWFVSRERAAELALLISVAAFFGLWHHSRLSLFAGDEIGLFARAESAPVALDVRAIRGSRYVPAPPPDPMRTIPSRSRTRIEVEALAIRDDDAWRPASGRLMLWIEGDLPGIDAGDRLRVFGQITAARTPHNPGELDTTVRDRARRQLAFVNAEFPESVTRVASAFALNPLRIIPWLRTRGDALLWQYLEPRRAALASAMFLGARDQLDPDLAQAFLETGTIHLLVVSGLNVAILASCLFFLLRVLLVPQTWSLVLVAVGCVLYAAVTDSEPPVVRATVMVLVACTGMIFGRRALAFNSIAAAGLCVLALNPGELFQPGTQLSFLSVIALAWIAQLYRQQPEMDPLDRLIAQTRPWSTRLLHRAGQLAWRSVLASTVIWFIVCPLVMSRFHLASPVAIVLGPILAIPVTVAMATGMGVFLFGWVAPPVAVVLAAVCNASLGLMLWAVDSGRGWWAGHFWLPGPQDWWLVGFYVVAALILILPWRAPPWRWCFAMACGWMAVGLVASPSLFRATDRFDCTFLAVGHGSAIVLELPGGQTILYDAGRLGSPTYASRAIAGYLWSRGIRHLDAVVISHADADHYNALPALVEQFTIGKVIVSPVMFEASTPALDALYKSLVRSGIPIEEAYRGDSLKSDSPVSMEVLHPGRRGTLGRDNSDSIVLAVEYAGRRLLLTGDLESPGLDEVVAEAPYHCDVLLAPHHGSQSSDPPGFAAWSTPDWTIVSGGQRDRLDSVHNAYADRGSRVLHTSTAGAVCVSIAPNEMQVRSWHDVVEHGQFAANADAPR